MMKKLSPQKDIEDQKLILMEELIDLIPGYLENVRKDLSILQKSVKDKNTAEIKMVAHRVKGSARSYGFDFLDDTMEKIQCAVKCQDLDTVQKETINFAEYLDRINQALNEREGM